MTYGPHALENLNREFGKTSETYRKSSSSVGDSSLRVAPKYVLVGGLEHFLFSIIYGIILPIDFHIFQDGSNHQPDNNCHL